MGDNLTEALSGREPEEAQPEVQAMAEVEVQGRESAQAALGRVHEAAREMGWGGGCGGSGRRRE